MPVEFPLKTKLISLGPVADPVIPLPIRTTRGFVSFDFLVDTGADCSVMPVSLAEKELGLRLSDYPAEIFYGIEGSDMAVRCGRLSIAIGAHHVQIRCLFSSRPRCPLILGRMDVFRHFSIAFDNRRHVVRFTKIGR